jgi:hypothetical protein
VTVRYGEPLRFEEETSLSRERQQQVADQIFEVLRALHGRMRAVAGGVAAG